MNGNTTKGNLRPGWSASVDDYAIAGDWALNGDLLVVFDAAGGLFGFEATSGKIRWQHPEVHAAGGLAMAVRPGGQQIATAGQDGRVLLWNAAQGIVCNSNFLQTAVAGRKPLLTA